MELQTRDKKDRKEKKEKKFSTDDYYNNYDIRKLISTIYEELFDKVEKFMIKRKKNKKEVIFQERM